MRATIHQLLIAETSLTAVIPQERWYQMGNVLDIPRKPFAILRWIAPVRGDARGTFSHQFQVAIHDERGSYDRIEELLGGPYRLGGVYPVLSGIMGITGIDGYIAQADYLGDSGDDVDVDYKSNTKYSSWQIAGRTTS
jgi:hypothetical protein